MPYEIPTELQYQEKIVFGLTFPQLAWALLFASPALYIMLKTSLLLPLKVTAVTIFAAIGICFMFLDALEWARSLLAWVQWRSIEVDSPEMEEFLPITDIQSGCVHTGQDGNRRVAILCVTPINFAIKTPEAQEAVISGFRRFLNAIDFPVQVVIGTDMIELDSYLDGLQEHAKSYSQRFQDYRTYLKQVVSEDSVQNRIFYLVIPKHPGKNLDIQVHICREMLASMDLVAERLDDRQLEPALNELIGWPTSISNGMGSIEVDGVHSRILYAHGYPRSVEPGFLDRIVTLKGNFDLSLHIEPFPLEHTMVMVNRELQKQRADLYSAERSGILMPSLEFQHRDTLQVLDGLQKGAEKLFRISLYIKAKADTPEDLDRLTATLAAELNALLILPRKATFRMAQGFQSCLPIAINALGQRRSITTKPLSAFFPFTSRFLQVDEQGVWFGLNKTQVPLIRDIFSLSNPNGLILASSGAGKSFLAKLLIMRQLLSGTQVLIIDPQGEYSPLVDSFDGQLVTLSRTSETIINPLDLMGHSYAEKRLALMDLMPVMLGDLSEAQKAAVDSALTKVYASKAITDDPETWNRKPPILGDLLAELERGLKKVSVIEKATYRSLCNRVSMYVTGVFGFLNTHTKLDFDNKFVCFNIGDMPRQVKPVLMFLVLDYCYLKMKDDCERKLLVVDEAWSLLGRAADASYLFEIVKTCRKFSLGLLLITQDVADLLRSKAGNAVLANSAYTILLRQKAAVIDEVVRTFHLSGMEKDKLLTAQIGEGILLMENEHTELQIVASDSEQELIEHMPETHNLKPGKRQSVEIAVDPDKPLYHIAQLSEDDEKYLMKQGFTTHTMVDIHTPGPKAWLLKGSSHESPEHYFLVHRIAEYIREKTDNVWLYETRGPDIVFQTSDGRKVALEIESGSRLKSDKESFLKKVEQLNEDYGEDWMFVVTHRNLIRTYARYGHTYSRGSIKAELGVYFP